MRRIERLAQGEGIIYVAGRLFDIDEKLKSEALEEAVLDGTRKAATTLALPIAQLPTFVPFRDAGQEELIVEDKTRRLFELDLARLRRTVLLVSYIDGLAKDEGVCFEIGYVYAIGGAILLISTDFCEIELPSGHTTPLDPLLHAAATRLIRRPRLVSTDATFRDSLLSSRAQVLADVQTATAELLIEPDARQARLNARRSIRCVTRCS
ncbi:MAG: nucleoside 2-deoxyribosyltransferase [Pseudonocardiaceae bacterium]